MSTATLTSKFQLSIPKLVRDQMGLKAGQKFSVIAKGSVGSCALDGGHARHAEESRRKQRARSTIYTRARQR